MSEGIIVTFYSYKGGVGRTFALANIGALLSLWGYKTLCVDWDLEAPGLHLYFKQWMKERNPLGLTDIIQAHVEGMKPEWQNYITEVHFSNANEPLLLMSAGLQDESYFQRMQTLDWSKLYESHNLGNFLEGLRESWKESLDFVLIDSRTGISDIGGICTVQLPDLLILLLTANDQSLYGSLDVLRSVNKVHTGLPLDRSNLLVMPVISRFEGRFEYALAQKWLATFAKVLAPILHEWLPVETNILDLLNFTRIPYVPYWSFGEKLPVIEKGTEDPDDIGFPLESLAALLAQRLSGSEKLVNNRSLFVTEAKRGPVKDEVELEGEQLETDHTTTVDSLNNLAKAYRNQGRYEEAEPLLQRALAIREKTFGPDHPTTAVTLNNLGWIYTSMGRYEEAEPLLRRALAINEMNIDSDKTIKVLEHYIELLQLTQREEEAKVTEERLRALKTKYST